MYLRIQQQPVACLSFLVILLAINSKCPTYAQTDAQRRRQFLKMLTPDTQNQEHTVDTPATKFVNQGHIQNNVTKGAHVSDSVLVGATLRKRVDKEPPLIGERDTKLTPLTMMGKFKKTWCKTEPFMQLIKEPGCINRRVLNRFCYGQCNSFYIPRTLRKRMKKKVFKSCGVCKPKRTHTIVVTLKCPGRAKGYKHKKVKQIKQCRCMER